MDDKPSLNELILAIDDVCAIDNELRMRNTDLKFRKDYLLEKCDAIKRVMNAYLEQAPTLNGYIITIEWIETDLKRI